MIRTRSRRLNSRVLQNPFVPWLWLSKVDTLHSYGIAVFMDFVAAHFAKETTQWCAVAGLTGRQGLEVDGVQ